MKSYAILTAETMVQIITMLILYPVLIAMALYVKFSRKYGFTDYSVVCGVGIFPAWGKWWLPMLWLGWHYYA